MRGKSMEEKPKPVDREGDTNTQGRSSVVGGGTSVFTFTNIINSCIETIISLTHRNDTSLELFYNDETQSWEFSFKG